MVVEIVNKLLHLLDKALLCETTKSLQEENSNLIQNLNQANELGVDFMCYNMCKDTTKGMSLNQLDKFCKLQCPIK